MKPRRGLVEMVILVCPVCATPQDAPVCDEAKEFSCHICGQIWIMSVDVARFHEHALT